MDIPFAHRLTPDGIPLYKYEHFADMHKAGRVVAEILDKLPPLVYPGQTTQKIDAFIEEEIKKAGAISATIGYRGYRHASCISVNHVVCHGIPNEKKLRDGDILNIDITAIVDGWYGDSSRMYISGTPNRRAQRIIKITHESLMKGIEIARPGKSFGDIGAAIQSYVESNHMSVVRDFCGHGIGRKFHTKPNVLHYGRRGSGAILEEGMLFTIEPMVNLGSFHTKILKDGWTAVTRDRKLSAQFEHTIGITADGCEIFTLSPAGIFHPEIP